MESKVNYFAVGLFVVVLTALFVIAVIWFTAAQHKKHDIYLVYMKEAATGLSLDAPVKFNGVDVGTVKDIRLNYANPQEVCLVLSIVRGTPINQSTTATLMVQGITGLTYVGLSAGAIAAPPIVIRPNERYPVITYKPSLLVQLNSVLLDVADSMKSMRKTLKSLFSEENQRDIKASLHNIAKVTGTLANNTQRLDQIFKEMANTLLATKTLMNTATHDTMPGLNQSLGQLNNVLGNMEQLTNELKNNPSMLIRGKAPQPLGPGE